MDFYLYFITLIVEIWKSNNFLLNLYVHSFIRHQVHYEHQMLTVNGAKTLIFAVTSGLVLVVEKSNLKLLMTHASTVIVNG